jgi:hypothetical protein
LDAADEGAVERAETGAGVAVALAGLAASWMVAGTRGGGAIDPMTGGGGAFGIDATRGDVSDASLDVNARAWVVNAACSYRP